MKLKARVKNTYSSEYKSEFLYINLQDSIDISRGDRRKKTRDRKISFTSMNGQFEKPLFIISSIIRAKIINCDNINIMGHNQFFFVIHSSFFFINSPDLRENFYDLIIVRSIYDVLFSTVFYAFLDIYNFKKRG